MYHNSRQFLAGGIQAKALLFWRLRPCLNVLTESVHKICRQNLSKIKLCDWPNNLDATSWQVLNTTECVEMDRF